MAAQEELLSAPADDNALEAIAEMNWGDIAPETGEEAEEAAPPPSVAPPTEEQASLLAEMLNDMKFPEYEFAETVKASEKAAEAAEAAAKEEKPAAEKTPEEKASGTQDVSAAAAVKATLADLNLHHLSNMKQFLMHPAPKEMGMIQCQVERIKTGGFGAHKTHFVMRTSKDGVFLLSAKKRSGLTSSTFAISMANGTELGDHVYSDASPFVLGQVRANNMVRTEFRILDNGVAEDGSIAEALDGTVSSSAPSVQLELGVVVYVPNEEKIGPRRVLVGLPKIDNVGEIARPKRVPKRKPSLSLSYGGNDMISNFRKNQVNDIMLAKSKSPVYNEKRQAWVLDFIDKRVTKASIKNFQLVSNSDAEEAFPFYQFGKTNKDSFVLDFMWPVTPIQAFAIALSSFDAATTWN